MVDYRVISGDGHIDLVWLPEDLFVSEAPASLKERMPKVVETNEGRIWQVEGAYLGSVASGGLTSLNEPYKPGISHRLDKMEELGFFSDAQMGKYHPTTPQLRKQDLEVDGLQGEVIYGILGFAAGFSDGKSGTLSPEVITAVYDIYNTWIADFCSSNPDQFAGLACIASHDPQVAAKQLQRAAGLGLKGAEINVAVATKPIYHKDWDILWATAAECKMPISFHTLGLPYRQPEPGTEEEYQWIDLGLLYTLFQLSGPEFLVSILLSGACDRHPDFRFVLGECGVGWLPYILERIDQLYEDRLAPLNLSMKPSEFWHRQGYSTFQDERLSQEVIQAVGEDNIIWGSDYPHPDCIWPDSQAFIQRNLGQLDEKVRSKVVCENAGKLYGFLK